MSIAEVLLWGRRVGAVQWDAERELGRFEYDPAFRNSPVELAPLCMPKQDLQVWEFLALYLVKGNSRVAGISHVAGNSLVARNREEECGHEP